MHSNNTRWCLVVHGGAGKYRLLTQGICTPQTYLKGIEEALQAGAHILQQGGSAIDAVVQAITAMENNPIFNAGRGSVLTRSGHVEMDACLMDGKTRQIGSVAAVRRIANPIQLAQKVLYNTEHVLLCAEGAEDFAQAQGIPLTDPQTLITQPRQQEIHEHHLPEEWGTVGAVALDQHGNLCAGTSSGGLAGKLPGRIGDSAIAGASTYALNHACAVSTTGIGEYFQRLCTAFHICLLYTQGTTLEEAVQTAFQQIEQLGGRGGLIALDHLGNYFWIKNTPYMARGVITPDNQITILH